MTEYSGYLPLMIMSSLSGQCRICGASCSYLPITDEVGEFDTFSASYCLMPPVENYFVSHYQHIISPQISISDEATGKSVFQGPCEAYPVMAGAHIRGLSALCSMKPKLTRFFPFFYCSTIAIYFKCQSSQDHINMRLKY